MIADGAKGRIRVRPLAEDKNREPGYGISGYVIRRGNDEKAIADKLEAFAAKVLAASGAGFEQQPTSQRSQWYVSAFLCP